MIARISRIVAAVVALVMFGLFLITPPTLISDQGEETAMLPPCDVDEGLPFIDDDEVTCYWGMSEDVVELIKAVDSVDVTIDVAWEKDGVWVGVARASEASKCTLRDGYYECPQNGVDLLAGGPSADGGFSWTASSGDVRFVVGGDDSQQLQQFNVAWSYDASLPEGTGNLWFLLIGILGLVYAVVGPQRIFDWGTDALLLFT
ncbi:MAG: hypothetical protein ACPH5S_00635 [Candidatus Poseidoniaceae archaeon]